MDYKKLTDVELRQILQEFKLQYGDLFHKEKDHKGKKKFVDILKKQKLKDAETIAEKVKKAVEERIIRQINYIAQIQYFIMEKTGDYTDLGEQRVSISYCRFFLNIPPETEVTQFNFSKFKKCIEEERSFIKNLSIEELQELEKAECLDVLGEKYNTFQDEELNKALFFIGSKKRITIVFFGKHRSIIFGDVEESKINDYRIYQQLTEDARTPTNCLSIAAIIGEKNVVVRWIALETIFYNKWMQVFKYSNFEVSAMFGHTESNIREMLKIKSLEAYNVYDPKDLTAIKKTFIEEMIEGVLWHEIGHGLSMDGVDMDLTALGEAFMVFEDNIVGAIKEFMADAAMPKGKMKGPLNHFIDLAKKSKDKATRMLLVYLSDNWFLDVTEEFMADQTDLIVTVMSNYLLNDKEFDFKRMKKDLPKIYKKLDAYFMKIVGDIKDLIEKTNYCIKGIDYPFAEVKEMVIKIMEEERDNFTPPEDTLQYKTNFWSNMINYVQKYAPETYKNIETKAGNYNALVKEDFLTDLLSKKIRPHINKNLKANSNDNNIRTFLFKKLKGLGFYR